MGSGVLGSWAWVVGSWAWVVGEVNAQTTKAKRNVLMVGYPYFDGLEIDQNDRAYITVYTISTRDHSGNWKLAICHACDPNCE